MAAPALGDSWQNVEAAPNVLATRIAAARAVHRVVVSAVKNELRTIELVLIISYPVETNFETSKSMV